MCIHYCISRSCWNRKNHIFKKLLRPVWLLLSFCLLPSLLIIDMCWSVSNKQLCQEKKAVTKSTIYKRVNLDITWLWQKLEHLPFFFFCGFLKNVIICHIQVISKLEKQMPLLPLCSNQPPLFCWCTTEFKVKIGPLLESLCFMLLPAEWSKFGR